MQISPDDIQDVTEMTERMIEKLTNEMKDFPFHIAMAGFTNAVACIIFHVHNQSKSGNCLEEFINHIRQLKEHKDSERNE